MTILYVILTCSKNADRADRQKNTWLKYIGENDRVVYLGDEYDIRGGYENVYQKYQKFIKEFNQFDFYDWVFFCDDDTFVFPSRLNHLLRYQNKDEYLLIGRTGEYEGVKYCSGGAGFAVSYALIESIKWHTLVSNFPNSDTTFALWAKQAEPNLKIIDRVEQFQTQHLKHPDNSFVDIDCCITFHYCGEHDYKILSKHLKYAI